MHLLRCYRKSTWLWHFFVIKPHCSPNRNIITAQCYPTYPTKAWWSQQSYQHFSKQFIFPCVAFQRRPTLLVSRIPQYQRLAHIQRERDRREGWGTERYGWSAGAQGVKTMLGVSLRARRHTTHVMLGLSLRARWDTTLVLIMYRGKLTIFSLLLIQFNIQFKVMNVFDLRGKCSDCWKLKRSSSFFHGLDPPL